MRIKTKTTPKKASPKKSRARKSDSIRKKKVAVKPGRRQDSGFRGQNTNFQETPSVEVLAFLN